MDSQVALALMSKIRRVFEPTQAFLAFPLAPFTYTRRQWSWIGARDHGSRTGREAIEALACLADFSLSVNQIPAGPIWPPADPRYLWEIYGRTLREMRLAASTRTDAEQAAYRSAWQVLHRIGPDDVPEESDAVRAYRQFEDFLERQYQVYRLEKARWEQLPDDSSRRRWHDLLEPAYLRGLQQFEKEWVQSGYKEAVETARRTVEHLGGRSPWVAWREWQFRFQPSVDLLTDPTSGSRFVPTTFAPSNALDPDSWMQFHLSARETAALVQDAPEELRRRLVFDPNQSSLESLSFDCTSVRVVRPWLDPLVFSARFWDLDPPPLSDGGNPATGALGAWITGLILARNLETKPSLQPQTHGAPGTRASTVPASVGGGFWIDGPPSTTASDPHRSTPVAENPGTVPSRVYRQPVEDFVRRGTGGRSVPLPDDEPIHVAALVCERVPRCPNPDRSLNWSEPNFGS